MYIFSFPVNMVDVITDKVNFLKNNLYIDADFNL